MKFSLEYSITLMAAWSIALGFVGCASESGPNAASQTNWLKSCELQSDCGEMSCVCGSCVTVCETDSECDALPGTSCVQKDETGAIALCGGKEPETAGICLVRCDDEMCAEGTSCVAEVCTRTLEPSVLVTLDATRRHQTLHGFGAALAYAEDAMVAHPMKSELFDALFEDSGLSIIRLRNRYEGGNDDELLAAREILEAATERMTQPPLTLMTSGSPPASLKANNSRNCSDNPDTCMLISLPSGEFDYAGFAEHWRASLVAYAATGINPDYISIQNDPNWIPSASESLEACKFLPSEGPQTVSVDGEDVEITYPGYGEALSAVLSAVATLEFVPKFAAPEVTSPGALPDYLPAVDQGVDALAYHMYTVDPDAIDRESLEALAALTEEDGRPLFQSEMRSAGVDTAILMQAALTISGASMYLQNDFVAPSTATQDQELSLIALEEETFVLQDNYYTMQHFAAQTAAGWIRIESSSDDEDLLTSAFISPSENAFTLVLVNIATTERDVEVSLEDLTASSFESSEVHRTTFDGLERFTNLGSLDDGSTVRVPPNAIVTIAFFDSGD